ncbi:hypothetical protein [Actinoplanes regularis]|uniref:Uncharacterized protein n=1 Tax=Actinoplanes regularis TaxID=52697 RepID=A0A238XIR4_9ACTN|nr:hypothetical protein [Actinoplanes regularis]GIE90509.1 hypothetical protein Are01nite_69890 [Actinoplanes regularis]SNR58895.1 hypothetical protein SAMN06264365_103501 [Actinoplanes regularis]
MSLYQVGIYHNTTSTFLPYDSEDLVSLVFTFDLERPDGTSAEQVADWAFRAFNADLDLLESDQRDGNADPMVFPLACLYRLLRLRSVAVGDVLRVACGEQVWWLGCGRSGWDAVDEPWPYQGKPLTAKRIYEHLAADRQR